MKRVVEIGCSKRDREGRGTQKPNIIGWLLGAFVFPPIVNLAIKSYAWLVSGAWPEFPLSSAIKALYPAFDISAFYASSIMGFNEAVDDFFAVEAWKIAMIACTIFLSMPAALRLDWLARKDRS